MSPALWLDPTDLVSDPRSKVTYIASNHDRSPRVAYALQFDFGRFDVHDNDIAFCPLDLTYIPHTPASLQSR